jgi:hypothetical protein
MDLSFMVGRQFGGVDPDATIVGRQGEMASAMAVLCWGESDLMARTAQE